MGLLVKYIHADAKTGRLIYRRAFPETLQPFLAKQRRELKVPLGARSIDAPGALARWAAAHREFDMEVQRASASRQVHQKQREGAFDALTPELIRYLAAMWQSDDLALEHETRWINRPLERKQQRQRALRESCKADLAEALELRGLGDMGRLVELWGEAAAGHAEGVGFLLDRDGPHFAQYIRAFHDMQIECWQTILRRLDGEEVPTPVAPPAPARPPQDAPRAALSFPEIVNALLENPRYAIGASAKEATLTALRFWQEVHAEALPGEITRRMVTDWLDLLSKRPTRVAKADRKLPLPALVARYEGKEGLPRLSLKTQKQHLGMLAARWAQAQEEDYIPRELGDPFKRKMPTAQRSTDPQEFSIAELEAMFSLPVFKEGARPLGGKGEASYWMPLLLLWTGARPEELAQLTLKDFADDPELGRWCMTITDQGEHPEKGQQLLKTSRRGSGRRSFPVPQALLDLNLRGYVEHLEKAGEAALFPAMRPKGARGHLYPGWATWWAKYLRDNKVLPEGVARKPAREFRHVWNTAARRAEIPEDAREYLMGHYRSGASSNDRYGAKRVHGVQIDKLAYPWFGPTNVNGWKAPT